MLPPLLKIEWSAMKGKKKRKGKIWVPRMAMHMSRPAAAAAAAECMLTIAPLLVSNSCKFILSVSFLPLIFYPYFLLSDKKCVSGTLEQPADTEFDSLLSEKVENSPPIDSSSSNSSSSHCDRGDELDTQDSTTYMDCVEGTQQSTNTNTNTNSSSVSSSPAATASPTAGHSAEGGKKSKKDKKDKKRKHNDGDKDESAEDCVVAAASAVPSTGATPNASGHSLARTNSNNLATTVTVDGALPDVIEGDFKYKEVPPSKKNKHKKSRLAVASVDSPSPEIASKSAIIPIDITAFGFGGSSFPFGDSRMDIHATSGNTAAAGLDEAEDVGEAIQIADATINHLQHVALKQALSVTGVGGGDKNRSVTLPVGTVTDMLGNLPEDHTSISGPNLAALQNTVKKYGKK